jgi:hypothetical protein
MEKSEMLHALIGKPMDERIEYCRSKGLTNKYSEKF